MKSGFRKLTRTAHKLELSKSVPNVDTDVDETKAFQTQPKDEQTERLTRARRQIARAGSLPPKADSAAPPAKKVRSWLRFFGLGGRPD